MHANLSAKNCSRYVNADVINKLRDDSFTSFFLAMSTRTYESCGWRSFDEVTNYLEMSWMHTIAAVISTISNDALKASALA